MSSPTVTRVSTIAASRVTQADQRAQRGEDPDDGGRCHPDDGALPGQDHATTQEADTGDDLAQDPGRIHPFTANEAPSADEQLGPRQMRMLVRIPAALPRS